ncbi:Uncharacterised protein [BD1-7 clade bacterium]|uniref:Methyltransferase FkbM domain-containing protein n=1 Tax=BD1-7 clade bacterium TaxID=2029982 RepID=A0A5S9PKM8_9GAMM|nr:Uncharacterised protein [BD1-7 clade bacterium]CAA0104277.1 Uncharacterised protein [BD1-7 clade bacterium]
MLIPEIGFNASYLSFLSKPKTVFDVGVGYGTPELYKAYPKASFILVEPLIEFQEAIEALSLDYDMQVHYKAVAEKNSVKKINIDTELLQRSSFNERTNLTKTKNEIDIRKVEVTTLDDIYFSTDSIQAPVLLKIDTEGNELLVLKGAKELLKITDTVIAEVSISKRFHNGYSFDEIVIFMAKNNFEVFSFLKHVQPKGELRQRFVDVVFKRKSLNKSSKSDVASIAGS